MAGAKKVDLHRSTMDSQSDSSPLLNSGLAMLYDVATQGQARPQKRRIDGTVRSMQNSTTVRQGPHRATRCSLELPLQCRSPLAKRCRVVETLPAYTNALPLPVSAWLPTSALVGANPTINTAATSLPHPSFQWGTSPVIFSRWSAPGSLSQMAAQVCPGVSSISGTYPTASPSTEHYACRMNQVSTTTNSPAKPSLPPMGPPPRVLVTQPNSLQKPQRQIPNARQQGATNPERMSMSMPLPPPCLVDENRCTGVPGLMKGPPGAPNCCGGGFTALANSYTRLTPGHVPSKNKPNRGLVSQSERATSKLRPRPRVSSSRARRSARCKAAPSPSGAIVYRKPRPTTATGSGSGGQKPRFRFPQERAIQAVPIPVRGGVQVQIPSICVCVGGNGQPGPD